MEKKGRNRKAVFLSRCMFFSFFIYFFHRCCRVSDFFSFFFASFSRSPLSFAALCANMAGAAPAASAAAAGATAEHTRGTLVWVRPKHQQGGGGGAASKLTTNSGGDDDEEWVKATVTRVLDDGATLEVALEGSSGGEGSPKTITVSSADAPLQNPASRLGVEVRFFPSFFFRWRRRERERERGAPFFQHRHRLVCCPFCLSAFFFFKKRCTRARACLGALSTTRGRDEPERKE